ncbi:MAG: hypothetical protein QMD14_04000 [Candidatus Aenigmarchaeota archaeon]|nr:hypothetical protein [Candidatus Aenigmarchaeota archaeon]
MGILEPIEDKAIEEKLTVLSERITNLEAKIDDHDEEGKGKVDFDPILDAPSSRISVVNISKETPKKIPNQRGSAIR